MMTTCYNKNKIFPNNSLLAMFDSGLREKKGKRYVSSGELKSLAVLIVSKVLMAGQKELENGVFKEDEVVDIDFSKSDNNKVVKMSNEIVGKIDEVLIKYNKDEIDRAKKYSNKMLYKILSHKNLENPVSLLFLGQVFLFSYFIEGAGKKAKNNFAYFKNLDLYNLFLDYYEKTEMLSFVSDQEICLDALMEL